MRLFFEHVLAVRPECMQNRRAAKRAGSKYEWCTDGVAASSIAPGMFGPVLAFRGEIEAQGRGFLHPHILVWLLGISAVQLLQMLRRDRATFQSNLAKWMRASVASIESVCQGSVQTFPRRFGALAKDDEARDDTLRFL